MYLKEYTNNYSSRNLQITTKFLNTAHLVNPGPVRACPVGAISANAAMSSVINIHYIILYYTLLAANMGRCVGLSFQAAGNQIQHLPESIYFHNYQKYMYLPSFVFVGRILHDL
jgi:hypothetical protein